MHLQLFNTSVGQGNRNYSICMHRWLTNSLIIMDLTQCQQHRLIIIYRITMPMQPPQHHISHKSILFNNILQFYIIPNRCHLALYFIQHQFYLIQQWLLNMRHPLHQPQALFRNFLSNRKWLRIISPISHRLIVIFISHLIIKCSNYRHQIQKVR